MPIPDVHPRNDMDTTLLWDDGQAAPTLTVTINSGHTGIPKKKVAGDTHSLSPGIIGAIVAVSVLAAVCMVTAATLHRSWCMNPRCKVCLVLRCGRRKAQKGRVQVRRLPDLPTFSRSFDGFPDTPEKSGFSIPSRSPLDRRFRPDSQGDSTLVNQPRLQEIGGNTPHYSTTRSIVSNVASITTPYTGPSATTSAVVSAPPDPAANSDTEPVEQPGEGENYPPSAFDTANFNRARSRGSQASGMLSIITLPSFITNDRPRPYSSSVGVQIESPIRPHHRKRSSLFGQRFTGADSAQPVSHANDQDTGGNGNRPTSGALQSMFSPLKRSDSGSSVGSTSASPRRSPRRFFGRLNLSLGMGTEAVTEWRRLPPIPSAQGTPPAQTTQNRGVTGIEDSPMERLPFYDEGEPRPPDFFATQIPLPPSPSTPASSASSWVYATPSSPPPSSSVNGFTTQYASYIPLPPSIPSTPRQFSYPPTPNSADEFMDTRTIRAGDQTVSLASNNLRRLSGDAGWTHSTFSTPKTASISVPSGDNDGTSDYGPNDDEAGRSNYRESAVSEVSQYATFQEFAFPPPPLTSPRGPRPLPSPGRLNRSGTLRSYASSTGQ